MAAAPPTNHQELLKWVEEMVALCEPDAVEWADGSKEEYARLMDLMVSTGMATNKEIRHS